MTYQPDNGPSRKLPSEHGPQDAAHTMRNHAGEAITDGRNWPGYILIAAGIAVLGLTLVAAGYGFEGWALIGGIGCVLCLVLGTTLVLLERRRIKALEGESLTDEAGH
ncbi:MULTISPECIES: hypothetical protein [unclassified Rhodococcus (in: high G+C Gram-positive bacteria)]|uniref:hypothetical protein n=1 Tax=unclassified Rhodococcus (in: high G+C Gram-positive bacteria) TaxID=192944 RepID=UPI00163A85CA|nr:MULTISPECIES: hypothetical protein [unclassified Rhodococcus (in: high G+C Gram-positive bacteria)]MBC2637976.1 hypothetical protein [Rhodococcus sp. 3A]MBC2897277.1 hypothetical protein [Rhodococcus sp. 4CII]